MSDQVSIETLAVSETPSQDLQAIAAAIGQAAQAREGDSVALLALLRLLEQCHREICETRFRDSLPSNRHTLYTLLRDIEAHGGWPYIQRMKLRTLLANYSGLVKALGPELEVPPPADDPAFSLGNAPFEADADFD